MDDLDRLPRMSPVDEPVIPSNADRSKRPPWMTLRTGMILAGMTLIVTCGLFLFFTFGHAMLVDPALEGAAYWSEVLGRMFGRAHGGPVAWPASLGLILGFVLVVWGAIQSDRPAG